MSIERIRRRLPFPGETNFSKKISHTELEYPTGDPGEFKKFIDIHKGSSFVICGCGVSLNDYNFDSFQNHVTIGVNDAGKKINCKYLVVVNEPHTFKWGRWDSVKDNDSEYTFTHIKNLPIDKKERLVLVKLGKYEGLNLYNHGFIDYTTNSPYMAIVIACQMGAKKIALVGVDFTMNHFFGETGKHQMMREIEKIKEQYSNLGKHLIANGIKIANLSSQSLIEYWPKMTLDEFETI